MNHRMVLSILGIMLFGLWSWSGLANADRVFSWTDQDGRVHMSDEPPDVSKLKHVPVVPVCSFKSYIQVLGEERVRQFARKYIFVPTPPEPGRIPEGYGALYGEMVAERDRCKRGSEKACQCMDGIAAAPPVPSPVGGAVIEGKHPRAATVQKKSK